MKRKRSMSSVKQRNLHLQLHYYPNRRKLDTSDDLYKLYTWHELSNKSKYKVDACNSTGRFQCTVSPILDDSPLFLKVRENKR